ncbi:protein of unknown function [Pseudorhizobium banfieldiae]|uniref:Uncharacterized protein n=1 Tax=Pseudorhizobium banfieldiae TaxID=1125847 RepID=L0NKE6_9HYPH|nr:protein of unknown function [Pseudorhizobium banfieldiae]
MVGDCDDTIAVSHAAPDEARSNLWPESADFEDH